MIRNLAIPGALLALVLAGPVVAQAEREQAPPPALSAQAEGITAADVTQRRSDLESSDLDEATKVTASGLYSEIEAQVNAGADAKARASEARRLAAAAPDLLAAIQAELNRGTPADAATTPTPPSDATLAQLEQSQDQAAADLKAARTHLEELQAEIARRQGRRSEIPEQLSTARQRLGEVDRALQTPPAEGTEAPVLTEARRMLLVARRQAAAAEIDALEAELVNYDARNTLLPARRDRALRRVGEAEKLAGAWQGLVTLRRQAEVQKAADAARAMRATAQQHPVLRAFAEYSQELAEQRTKTGAISEKIGEATRLTAETRSDLAELRRRNSSVKERIAVSGMSRATGLVLRREFDDLARAPSLERSGADHLAHASSLRELLVKVQKDIETTDYALFQTQNLRSGAGDIDQVVRDLMLSVAETGYDGDLAQLESVARELAVARRDLLDELIEDAQKYFLQLQELDLSARRLLDATLVYESFIRERILWVRSVPRGQGPMLSESVTALRWLLEPGAWADAGWLAVSDSWPLVVNLGALSLILAFAAAPWCRRRLHRIASEVGSYRTDSFSRTLRALVLTAIASLPVAAMLWVIGYGLARPENQLPVAIAVGRGLQLAGASLLPFAFLRQALRPGGLADAHFRWPMGTIKPIRRNLRWFIPTILPVIAVVHALDHHGDEAASNSLGRLVFTVGMLALAVLVQRVLRPAGPTLADMLRRHAGGWLDRLRYVWYPALIGVPIGLIVLAWLGYYYSALQLEARLEQSLVIAMALVLVHSLLLRWLFVARRTVAVEDARRRRAQAQADAAARTGAERARSEVPPLAIEEDKFDLPAISAQTRQLFATAIVLSITIGLLAIWSDVLPALRKLDAVQIWPRVAYIETEQAALDPALEPPAESMAETGPGSAVAPGNGATPAGAAARPPTTAPGLPMGTVPAEPGSEARDDTLSISLADLGLAVLLLLATYVAFRNVPGLFEMVVLQRLPLDAASRYALGNLIRYTIMIIGVVAAMSATGIPWSKVQWLAAALTFGLAFGLQEIFANFVSGLVILGERPIRLGDIITVGAVSGKVSRIRMRATTVIDWDWKELIIPNKAFITGEVINWTLSDPTLRLVIPVGVSYGADVRRAESVLLRLAADHPDVLDEPRPSVAFRRFGDSTLDFELRVFIAHIDHLIAVRHDLHMAITEAFREEGIEIAFPQRDLHLRSIGELGPLLQKREDLARAEPPAGST